MEEQVMYHPGDMIIYKTQGVCKVLDICYPEDIEASFDKLYYKLSPVFGTGYIYIPVDTTVFMRPVISREEAENLIHRLPDIHEQMSDGKMSTVHLRNYYNSFLQTYDCETLFKLVKGIYIKTNGMQKIGNVDKAYLQRLEDLLYGELAVALDIPKETVIDYIKNTV